MRSVLALLTLLLAGCTITGAERQATKDLHWLAFKTHTDLEADTRWQFAPGTRIQLEETSLIEVPTADGQSVVVRAFLMWQVDTDNVLTFNGAGELVGFDMDMASQLATDLGVGLELVPLDPKSMADELHKGYYDIVMTGIVATPDRQLNMELSVPYQLSTLGFVVRDHRRGEFTSMADLKARKDLAIGLPISDAYFLSRLKQTFPDAKVVRLDDIMEFFHGTRDDVDALLFTAEAGSAFTLLYPAFSVVVPQPSVNKLPLIYAMPSGDARFAAFEPLAPLLAEAAVDVLERS